MNALLRNVAALSIVQGANYILPLISVPYLVRTLGADRFGAVAFGQAFVQYFVILTDYGFNYSATRAVAVSRNDEQQIARLYWSVSLIKVGLMLAGFVLMAVLILLVPQFRAEWPLYCLSYLAVLGNVLFPVWLFQGLERMVHVAALSIGARLLSLIGLFLLVRHPDDYLFAAALQAAAMPIAGVLATGLLFRMTQIPLRRAGMPLRKDLIETFSGSWDMFVSTAAVSLYANSNIFVLGLLETPAAVGYYAMADKLIRAALSALQPLAQALYPRMSYLFSRDVASALSYLTTIAVPSCAAGLILCLGLALAADNIVRIVFGANAEPASHVLRVLAFVPFVALLSNLIGVQMLFPLGRQRPVSRFQVATGAVSIVALVPMILHWGTIGSAANYLLSEIVITLGYAWIAIKALKEMGHATASS